MLTIYSYGVYGYKCNELNFFYSQIAFEFDAESQISSAASLLESLNNKISIETSSVSVVVKKTKKSSKSGVTADSAVIDKSESGVTADSAVIKNKLSEAFQHAVIEFITTHITNAHFLKKLLNLSGNFEEGDVVL